MADSLPQQLACGAGLLIFRDVRAADGTAVFRILKSSARSSRAPVQPGHAGFSPGLPASVTNDAALVSAEPGFVTAVRVLKVTVARAGVSVNVV